MAEIVVATILRPSGTTGVQTHFCTFVRWLEAKALPVAVMTPYNAPLWMVYPVFAVRRVLDLLSGLASVWWYRYWHTVFLEFALRRRLSAGNDCVVYAQCPLSAAAALRARRNARQRVVLVVHFNVSQADEWAGKGMISMDGHYAASIRRFEAVTLARLDGLVFVSEFMRAALMDRIPDIASVPFAVVPNFVSDPGVPSEAPTIDADLLIVGTLEPRKNQAYALEIVAAAARRGRKLSLTIAGDGPDRSALEAMAGTLGIADRVHFLGFVPDAAQLFSRHRGCLHVAHMESFGIVLIEAMSRGLPVFAPAVGGIPEVFEDGVEGRSIPLSDADVALGLILDWLEDENLMLRVKAAARSRFLERFEADRVALELVDFLGSTERL